MKAIRHTGIVVSDMKKALHFYRDLLGLKEVKRMDETGNYIWIAGQNHSFFYTATKYGIFWYGKTVRV